MSDSSKQHIGIVIVGHVDAGKSTLTGRLLYNLGGIKQRDLEKLREEAKNNGKHGFEFAYLMDKSKEERTRGITIQCATKEFFTDNYHYTIIDAPGHRDYIKNMISGASQVDVALLMVPAEMGGFEKAIAKGNHKKGEVQGQTRQHARLCYLLGINQLIVGINKMDSVDWSEKRYNEVKDEMSRMLENIGYKTKKVAFIPMSGFNGDNVTSVSDKAPWYKGFSIKKDKEKVKGHTLLDVLNNVVKPPKRDPSKPFRMSVSGVYKIQGVGDVITGRIEQGQLKPGADVMFTPSNVTGKVFSIEMHHKSVEEANPGDNVGLNIKGLKKENMPHTGDTLYVPAEGELKRVKYFKAQVFVQDHPGELKPSTEDGRGGFTPSIHVRCGRAPCTLSKIHWKMGKSTGNSQLANPPFLVAGEQAEVTFEPKLDMHVEAYKDCPGLGRIAVMDSNSLVMLGKITEVEYKD